MSLESIVRRIRDAFDLLNRREHMVAARRPAQPRERVSRVTATDTPALPRDGFAEEALPWLNAVHRFALRLTRGDQDGSADLVQETFLRAYRSWHLFERGTNCRSWLFTICKNVHLHAKDRASSRHEVPATDLDVDVEALGVGTLFGHATSLDLDAEVFDRMLDDRVIAAIDELPDDYRDVLVLSDLGDLHYGEIAAVLDIPLGTVKSRLFRARRQVQKRLIDYAADHGRSQDATA